MTTYDFGNGLVPAHKHVNGGGWVADTANVSDTAFIGEEAHVYGNVSPGETDIIKRSESEGSPL